MGGKYAKVTPRLPQYEEDPKYQDRVNDRKAEILGDKQGLTSSVLVKMFVSARTNADRIKEQLSEANLEIAALSQLIADQFDDEDISSLKVDTAQGGATVRVQVEPYSSVQDLSLIHI